ncbi:MAG: DUF3426 domain-containing protein [Rhodospirillaceae bacterium]|nr:DUF3426 domain-containing protein [Rhodospirillaceae bacterium]
MIITCPACGSRYLTDAAAIGGVGRKVRCANCKHTWLQQPATDLPRSLSSPAPIPVSDLSSFSMQPVIAPAPSRPAGGRIAGWTALVLLVIGALGGAILAREPITGAWPAAARLYESIGMPVDPPGVGLEVRNISQVSVVEEGVVLLIVEGEVVNTSDAARRVPALRAALRDASDNELQHWTFAARSARLGPGESSAFRTSVRKPSPDTASLAIFFAHAE